MGGSVYGTGVVLRDEPAGHQAQVYESRALRISGDVVLAGASTGDGALLDGVTSSIRATVRDYSNAKPLAVVLTNVSGDTYNAGGGGSGGDGAILDGADAGIKATVKNYTNAKPLTVVLVNVSGDAYNSGGGGGGDGAIQDGSNSSIEATVLDTPTASPAATDNPVLVQAQQEAGQSWRVSEQGKTGVHVAGGQVGVSGDVVIRQSSPLSVSISGDVVSPIRVREQGVVGVQVVGGSGAGTVGVSGDVTVKPVSGQTFPVTQSGSWVIAGSGDVALVDGVTRSTKAEVNLRGALKVSGDLAFLDGVDPSIRATVRDYPNANPVAVVLTNVSGDTYAPVPREPELATITGRVSAGGTTTVAGPYTGRVIKVSAYDLQAEGDTSQVYFGSGASGDRLTPQWLLGGREGVAKQVSQFGGGYIFKTRINQALVVESAGFAFRFSVSFHSGDSL